MKMKRPRALLAITATWSTAVSQTCRLQSALPGFLCPGVQTRATVTNGVHRDQLLAPAKRRLGRGSTGVQHVAPLPLPPEAGLDFKLPPGYRLGLLEPKDVPAAIDLFLTCFPPMEPPYEWLSGSSWLHRHVLTRAWDVWWWYLKWTSGLEVRWGVISRNGERLLRPDVAPTDDSLTLVIEEELTGRLVAGVELCLREPDGSLTPSIKPAGSRYEPLKHRPYLCNLAVSPPYRGQGLGKLLLRHGETVALEFWQQPQMYLHFNHADPVAANLYASAGYRKVEEVARLGWYQELMLATAQAAGAQLEFHRKELGEPSHVAAVAAPPRTKLLGLASGGAIGGSLGGGGGSGGGGSGGGVQGEILGGQLGGVAAVVETGGALMGAESA